MRNARDGEPSSRLTWADVVLSGAAAVAALALYVTTLLPDVGGPEDSPKFQFLGAVLGTAHPPGYPLYTMVSWAFSHLPWGSVAYRANLLSAVSGALAVGLTCYAARLMQLARAAALVAALGLATGRWFWWYSSLAEVYAFAAMLVAATLVLALAWARTQRAALFYAAVLVAGLATAHHPLAVSLVPAVAPYALLTAGKRMLRPAVVATAAALFLGGYVPYFYIISRTLAPAPYVEASARNLAQLADIILVRLYTNQVMPFGVAQLMGDRVVLVARLIVLEISVVGVALIIVGVALGWRRFHREMILLTVTALGTVSLVLITAGESQGMLSPAMPEIWLLVGVGATALARRVRWAHAPGVMLAGLAIGLPTYNLERNFDHNNLHGQQARADWFRTFITGLGPKAAFVDENYPIDMTVRYFDLVEDPIPGRRFKSVGWRAQDARQARREGFDVVAFEGGAALLEAEGLRFEPLVIRQDLSRFLERLDGDDIVVALAKNTPMPRELSGLGLHRDRQVAPVARAASITAVIANANGTGRRDARGDGTFRFEAGPDALLPEVASVPRAHIALRADESVAAIEIDGTPVVEAPDGLLLVVMSAAGHIQHSEAFPSSAQVRPVFAARDVQPSRLAGEAFDRACTQVESGSFVDVSPVAVAGGLTAQLEPEQQADWTIRVAGPTTFFPTLEKVHGIGKASLEVSHPADDPEVTELKVKIDARRPRDNFESPTKSAFRIGLGALPRGASARLAPVGPGSRRAVLCAAPPPDLVNDGSRRAILPLGAAGAPYFGVGWHPPERIGQGSVRWTSQERSIVLLPLEQRSDHLLTMDVRHAIADDTVSVSVNGHGLGSQQVSRGWMRHSWLIPASVVRAGTNEFAFVSTRMGIPRDLGQSDDGRRLGWAVRRLTVETR